MSSLLTNALFELPSVHVCYMSTGTCPDFQHHFVRDISIRPTHKSEENILIDAEIKLSVSLRNLIYLIEHSSTLTAPLKVSSGFLIRLTITLKLTMILQNI